MTVLLSVYSLLSLTCCQPTSHTDGPRGRISRYLQKNNSTVLSLLLILKKIYFSVTCSSVRAENNQSFSQRHPSNWVDGSEDEDEDDGVEATPPHNEDY